MLDYGLQESSELLERESSCLSQDGSGGTQGENCGIYVCIAIFDKYAGFGSLKGLQVMGTAGIVEPFSDEYNAHAAVKKIPLAALQKLNPPMNLLKIRPVSADFLNSDFKQDGFDSRQHLEF